ncbi:MAG: acetylglutamate kinase [Bacillota bacterium]|nr:acetylglutamate kinase [Bacillota bacterium]
MTYSHVEQAQILIEALPYIQKYNGKTVVIKYGGNAMINEELADAVMSDIILLSLVGIRVVLVHGGGPDINEMLDKTGKESRFADGLRCTDEETMDIVQMVLCGRVNKNLVGTINRKGGNAIGLCGIDGGTIKARKYVAPNGNDYGLVGEITAIDPALIQNAIENHYIPVVSSVAQGEDSDVSYNINADTAASKLAVALNAEKLILLTDVKGVLRDPKDDTSLISEIHPEDVSGLLDSGIITGGMIPKIECCVNAIRGGVRRTHILDGRVPHSILIELFSHKGVGTMIR